MLVPRLSLALCFTFVEHTYLRTVPFAAHQRLTARQPPPLPPTVGLACLHHAARAASFAP